MRGERDAANLERKMLKWWIQSFLLGVPKIVVGFRSRDGVLTSVDELDTASIPASVQRRGRSWDGNTCINFCAALLDCASFLLFPLFVPSHLLHLAHHPTPAGPTGIRTSIDDDGVWRIRRKPRSPAIEMFKIEETGHGRILTDEFINWRIKLSLPPPPPADAWEGQGGSRVA